MSRYASSFADYERTSEANHCNLGAENRGSLNDVDLFKIKVGEYGKFLGEQVIPMNEVQNLCLQIDKFLNPHYLNAKAFIFGYLLYSEGIAFGSIQRLLKLAKASNANFITDEDIVRYALYWQYEFPSLGKN